MDFIKIAICDDEKNIRAYLSSLVSKQGAECEIAEIPPLKPFYTEFRIKVRGEFVDLSNPKIGWGLSRWVVGPAFSCFWMPLIEGRLGGLGYYYEKFILSGKSQGFS